MLVIRTALVHDNSGRAKIVAKAQGKQRTISYDPGKSFEVNYAAAAGTLANVLLDSVQQAKVRHPSGGQRVRMDRDDGKCVVYINV